MQIDNLLSRSMGLLLQNDPQGRRLVVASRFALTLVILAGVATVLLAIQSRRAEHWVRHTLDVRMDVRTIAQDVQAAVLRERAFLLTREKRKLGTDFEKSLTEIRDRLAALTVSVADNPPQVEKLNAVQVNVAQLSKVLIETVGLVEADHHEQAIEVVRSDKVQGLLDDLNAQLAELVRTEENLLVARESDADALQFASLLVIAASLAVALALSLVLLSATRHFVGNLQRRTSELEEEIKRRETSENAMRQMQKMEVVGQLSGGVAHDFNNLLTIILGNLEMMKRKVGRPDVPQSVVEKHIDMAQLAGRNATKLTHRLLAFARRQPLQPSKVDCNKLVSDISEMVRRTLGEAVDFETVLGAGTWPAFVDPNQLENALLNLAINAQHAMPDGGKLTIETANTYLDDAYAARFGDVREGQYVLISVTDTGVGIAPDMLEKVFEPFFTTKPMGQGTGLGLSMVHGFVKQSGGHVRIYSEVGEGTTVKMYMPRFDDRRMVAANPAPSVASSGSPVRAEGGETVLVVEDNDGVRDYAVTILTELGYVVREAATGDDAISILESNDRIDILFTDVVLPGGMSGRDLADTAAELRPGLPVLFTTGYTQNAIVHHGRLDAGVHFIGKPYTQHELSNRMSRILKAKS